MFQQILKSIYSTVALHTLSFTKTKKFLNKVNMEKHKINLQLNIS